ncbi:uncharacterized protein Nmag_3747 (plasmid) [Natrialba magadii ATCC 43099]|uniref:Uncharacterized protein n=1 Tax=Natrialba magadii (strain ATCC 43099 / DSM 3394 / CCM 3739 / CIP 104546 / IAM 13178 / JCM 8861 / NBRC 102185 / NCIMB 2190 / MS3) TaxID=547559 RepID=D3T130_NATMM|nr:polymer-forming cytoskeletal protein [Natrialba magadii]ADD07289.1 uncharacterized protein Nmag_3747 [Natrialba magadii ATCC 43099]ELY32717.1 hypothetical protein C500_03434 [Natrialba magadii ATCC 43099]
MRTITTLGIGFIILGAVVLTGPVFGFGTISADRGVSVQTAADNESLLEITDTSEQATLTPESDVDLFHLTDTTGQIDGVEIGSVSIDGVDAADFDTTVDQSDDEYVVSIACGDSAANTAAPVSVELVTSGGVSVTAERTTAHAIPLECGSDDEEETYEDEVDSNDDIEVDDDGSFEDDVDIRGGGSIDAGGDLTFEGETKLRGDISADGDITFEGDVDITGGASIEAGGTIHFKAGADLNGDVHAGEDVMFDEPPDTSGGSSITADGDVIGA